jgi:predicted alpha/beta hydrolase family esterase
VEATVVFIHGAGDGAYLADKLLAENLQNELGAGYAIRYPEMPDEDNAPYELWKSAIEAELRAAHLPIILVGHSIGGSHLAKSLTELTVDIPVRAIFLLDAPFWGGAGWRYDGFEKLQLPGDTAARLPKDAKVFLYHCRDDEIVPFTHLAFYAGLLPQATAREIDAGGHQLNNDLSDVAEDIRSLRG